jgi:hypothetical protein
VEGSNFQLIAAQCLSITVIVQLVAEVEAAYYVLVATCPEFHLPKQSK